MRLPHEVAELLREDAEVCEQLQEFHAKLLGLLGTELQEFVSASRPSEAAHAGRAQRNLQRAAGGFGDSACRVAVFCGCSCAEVAAASLWPTPDESPPIDPATVSALGGGAVVVAHDSGLAAGAAAVSLRTVVTAEGVRSFETVREAKAFLSEQLGGGQAAEAPATLAELRVCCPSLRRLRVLLLPQPQSPVRACLLSWMRHCCIVVHCPRPPESLATQDDVETTRLSAELQQVVELCSSVSPPSADEQDGGIVLHHAKAYCWYDCDSERLRAAAGQALRESFADFLDDAGDRLLRPEAAGVCRRLRQQLMSQQQASAAALLACVQPITRLLAGCLAQHQLPQVAAESQRRKQAAVDGDVQRLRQRAAEAAKKFENSCERRLQQAAVSMEQHLQQRQVRERVVRSVQARAVGLPPGRFADADCERLLLQQVAHELHSWNLSCRQLVRLDRSVNSEKAQLFRELQLAAEDIPEVTLLDDDVAWLSGGQEEPGAGLGQQSLASLPLLCISRRQLRESTLQKLASTLAAPLFAPLAVVTMAVMLPVSLATRSGGARPQADDRQIATTLKHRAGDFFDKLGADAINRNFFDVTRQFLRRDAERLRGFVDTCCLLPPASRDRRRLPDGQQLAQLQQKLQSLAGRLRLFATKRLRLGLLAPADCCRLGLDPDVGSEAPVGELLGSGAFSSVFGVGEVAVKLARPEATATALAEAELLQKLQARPHANVLQALGLVYFARLDRIGLVTRRCRQNLREYLRANPQLVPYPQQPQQQQQEQQQEALASCLDNAEQLLRGLIHLHSLFIVHRDLKMENVLVLMEDGRAVMKICDFGFSKEEELLSGLSIGGTVAYWAPELRQQRPQYSPKSDVFALGVVLWERCFGESVHSSVYKVGDLQGDSKLDGLIELMTKELPVDRPYAAQCLVLLLQ